MDVFGGTPKCKFVEATPKRNPPFLQAIRVAGEGGGGAQVARPPGVQGYLDHKKQPPPLGQDDIYQEN